MTDPRTGLPLTDPETLPLEEEPRMANISRSAESMILSASGWRKVFAPSGDEEDGSLEISSEDQYVAALIGKVFGDFFSSRGVREILLGMDSRPTGPALADPLARALLARGLTLRYLFIAAAPEVMAAARIIPDVGGFLYISASHNPLGHNGIKGGLKTGGVLTGAEASPLAEAFRKGIKDKPLLLELRRQVRQVSPAVIKQMYSRIAPHKEETERLYRRFLLETAENGQPREREALIQAIKAHPLGILGELNGSARTLSVDADYLKDLGLNVKLINNNPREIVHRIVPEGASLDLCRKELERLFTQDPAYQLGYVPDNDGDRGNLVVIDPQTGKGIILEAQMVFALSVLAELTSLKAAGQDTSRAAVVVNGPTSLRIEALAAPFEAQVFRAEVGEANVVSLAEKCESQGWTVRILGEGSNGGNITRPAAVRDPLNTLTALVKLLRQPAGNGEDLFQLWCRLSGQDEFYRKDYSLINVMESLPPFTTTSAYEDQAIMRITIRDHRKLKAAFEEVFPEEWEKRKTELQARFDFQRWEEINYEGIEAKTGWGPSFRSGEERGGLKIQFYNSRQKPAGYLWMRGSGTEPVFRIMAEIPGKNEDSIKGEKEMLQWLREMVTQADKRCS